MNLGRVALATVGGFVTFFALGGLTFAVAPFLRDEFRKYPTVYRPQDAMMRYMPVGMAAMFLAMLALVVLYAMTAKSGSGLAGGASFGALIGVFAIGFFVVHNYVNLNIGARLTVYSAVAYLIQWTLTGMVIGLIYRPAS
jgi:hypothetical protein